MENTTMEGTTGDSAVATDEATAFTDSLKKAEGIYNGILQAGIEQASQSYLQAQQTYSRELHDLFLELSERSQQVYRAYGESLNSAIGAAPAYEQCIAEYRNYLERLQQLLAGTEATQRAQAAYNAYLAKRNEQPGDASASAATSTLSSELDAIWKQEPLRHELQEAQGRYLQQLERLSEEVRERQVQAYRDMLSALGEIWAQPDINSRTQGALSRLIGAVREVLVQCHAAVEKGSSKAIEAMSTNVR